ncbi:hypothetical protein SAMN04488691_10321 [Haloferax larsenii]|uniref:Uncharacterized protein n=1 Tax=Haloferax larsenii TaxID=302484 RepID=A0A1H7MMV4_HALLR|nr:hypothetical protein SAMN04488691_10321 [Haloferax larsenii]
MPPALDVARLAFAVILVVCVPTLAGWGGIVADRNL